MKKKHRVTDSFNHAIHGLFYALKSERNMRIHIAAAVILVFLSFFFNLNVQEVMFVFMAVTFVVISELFNTAIEKLGDAITTGLDDQVRVAKDISAGAVLVSSVFAVFSGYLVFQNKAVEEVEKLVRIILDSPFHFSFLAVGVSLAGVIVIKVITRKGTPLKGGFPSGHSTVAFCLATVIVIITWNVYAALIAYVIAAMVAQSRMRSGIHSFLEVLFGATLGISAALLVYKILEVIL
ncbi:MAG: diacylglycerol kinase [Clostridia bacterium]